MSSKKVRPRKATGNSSNEESTSGSTVRMTSGSGIRSASTSLSTTGGNPGETSESSATSSLSHLRELAQQRIAEKQQLKQDGKGTPVKKTTSPPKPSKSSKSSSPSSSPTSNTGASGSDIKKSPSSSRPAPTLVTTGPSVTVKKSSTATTRRLSAPSTPPPPPPTSSVPSPVSRNQRAKALYDFPGAKANELPLKTGEIIENVTVVDGDWWRGTNAEGVRASFPKAYVELITGATATDAAEGGKSTVATTKRRASASESSAPTVDNAEPSSASSLAPGSRSRRRSVSQTSHSVYHAQSSKTGAAGEPAAAPSGGSRVARRRASAAAESPAEATITEQDAGATHVDEDEEAGGFYFVGDSGVWMAHVRKDMRKRAIKQAVVAHLQANEFESQDQTPFTFSATHQERGDVSCILRIGMNESGDRLVVADYTEMQSSAGLEHPDVLFLEDMLEGLGAALDREDVLSRTLDEERELRERRKTKEEEGDSSASAASTSLSSSSSAISSETRRASLNAPPSRPPPKPKANDGWTPLPVHPGLPARTRRRHNVINEIVHTEVVFIKDLESIVRDFLTPMRDQSLLSDDQVSVVFGNLEALLPMHRRLLEALQKQDDARPQSTSSDERTAHSGNVGTAFSSLLADGFVDTYRQFCASQSQADDALRRASKKSAALRKFIEAKSTASAIDLNALLIKPVQRLCKYPLLLRELTDVVDESKESAELRKAREAIAGAVTVVNENQRAAEARAAVTDILETVEGARDLDLLRDGRSYVMEGALGEIDLEKYTRKAPKTAHYFLFSDLLLRCDRLGAMSKAARALLGSTMSSHDDSPTSSPLPSSLMDHELSSRSPSSSSGLGGEASSSQTTSGAGPGNALSSPSTSAASLGSSANTSATAEETGNTVARYKFTIKDVIPLEELTVIDKGELSGVKNARRVQHAFQISYRDTDRRVKQQRTFTLIVDLAVVKRQWMTALTVRSPHETESLDNLPMTPRGSMAAAAARIAAASGGVSRSPPRRMFSGASGSGSGSGATGADAASANPRGSYIRRVARVRTLPPHAAAASGTSAVSEAGRNTASTADPATRLTVRVVERKQVSLPAAMLMNEKSWRGSSFKDLELFLCQSLNRLSVKLFYTNASGFTRIPLLTDKDIQNAPADAELIVEV